MSSRRWGIYSFRSHLVVLLAVSEHNRMTIESRSGQRRLTSSLERTRCGRASAFSLPKKKGYGRLWAFSSPIIVQGKDFHLEAPGFGVEPQCCNIWMGCCSLRWKSFLLRHSVMLSVANQRSEGHGRLVLSAQEHQCE